MLPVGIFLPTVSIIYELIELSCMHEKKTNANNLFA